MVWIINQAALSPQESGGTRHFSLARALASVGWESLIIREAGKLPAGEETIEGVRFLRLPVALQKGSYWQRLTGMLQFAKAVLKADLPGKPDVIIGSSPPLFAAAAACLLARRHKVPFVLEIRDLWPESLISLAGLPRIHPLVLVLRLIERWLYRKADRIVTLFPESVPYFLERGVKPERILVLPNGIDTSVLSPPAPPVAQDGFHLYYFGALGIPNGLEEVVEAARLLQSESIHFHFVGDGVRRAALIEQSQGLPNVHFHVTVPKNQMPGALAQADAFVLLVKDLPLYRWGASPNKLYDYLYAGRPVLYAAGSSPAVIAIHGAGRHAKPRGPEIASAALVLASLSANDRHAMGERGRAYVMAHHDMQKLGAQLAAMLSSLHPHNG